MSPYSRLWQRWMTSGTASALTAVEPGAIFEGRNERQTIEIAEIIGVQTDDLGVGHVRFRLSYRYQHRTVDAGERTLARETFLNRFGDV